MAKCRACDTYLTENMVACPECGLPRAIGTFKTIPTAKGKPGNGEEEIGARNPAEGDQFRPINVRVRDIDPLQARTSDVVYSTPEERRVLTPSAFLKTLLLMMIPIVGIGFQIYWGYHYNGNYNRRNLARAFLIVSAGLHLVSAGLILFRIFSP